MVGQLQEQHKYIKMSDPKVRKLEEKVYRIIHGDTATNLQLLMSGQASSLLGGSSGTNQKKGKEYLHFMYPNEFEYYACAMELISSDGKSKFFSFPVMPDSISEVKTTHANIKKTHGGLFVNNNSTFKPFDISISGDFGRKFRRMVRSNALTQNTTNAGDGNSATAGTGTLPDVTVKTHSFFDSDYKTGYGAIKLLENMIEESKTQDSNYMPYKLFFHNLSLNSSYLVEPLTMTISQSKDKNMIWGYSMQLKALAPTDAIVGETDSKGRLEKMLNLSKKNKQIEDQSEGILDILSDKGQALTRIQTIIKNQINARTQSILNNNQKSTFSTITQLVANPNDVSNFVVSFGKGILTKI